MIARKLGRPPVVDDDGIDYPESDGRPLGETDYHVDCILVLKDTLKRFFGRDSDVHVAADMFLYYEQGNPDANKAPDVMVTKGVGSHARRTFKVWIEGKAPDTIIEAVSRTSRREDTVEKPVLYARLGVKEYLIYDPAGDARLKPRFQAFRLQKGRLAPAKLDADGGFTSHELGLRFIPDGPHLRLIDLKTGQPVPYSWELAQQAQEERQRAEEERQRAEEERQRAEEERQRAQELQAEVDKLRAQLRKRGNPS